MKASRLLLLLLILISDNLLAQKYENLNIVAINYGALRSGQCYDPQIGYVECVKIGVVIVHLTSEGTRAGRSTTMTVDGALPSRIKQEFGTKSALPLKEFVKKYAKLSESDAAEDLMSVEDQHDKIKQAIQALLKTTQSFNELVNESNMKEWLEYKMTLNEIQSLAFAAGLSDESIENRTNTIIQFTNIEKTLIDVFKGVIDVASSFTPIVNDARDFYELTTGKDMVTGEQLGAFGRLCAGIGIIAGSGSLYRNIAKSAKTGTVAKTLEKATTGIPGLSYTDELNWVSEKGLIYRRHSKALGKENRLRHVLKHSYYMKTVTSKSKFSSSYQTKDIPKLIDQAWAKKGTPIVNGNGFHEYTIEMNKVVGTTSKHTKITIVTEKGSNNIITAYPVK